MSNRRERFDRAADQVLLTIDERASLLVLHEDQYLSWLENGKGLEIRSRRLAEIIGALVLLSEVFTPEEAYEWLHSRDTVMAPRIPAAVLRVGRVEDVTTVLRCWETRGPLRPDPDGRSTNPRLKFDSKSTQPVVLLGFLRQIGMTDQEIAKAGTTNRETVEQWSNGHRGNDMEAVTNLGKLASIVERLATLIKVFAIAPWLRAPAPALGGRTPIDVMGQGDYIEVERVVASREGTIAT